jgi:hypothetical protein
LQAAIANKTSTGEENAAAIAKLVNETASQLNQLASNSTTNSNAVADAIMKYSQNSTDNFSKRFLEILHQLAKQSQDARQNRLQIEEQRNQLLLQIEQQRVQQQLQLQDRREQHQLQIEDRREQHQLQIAARYEQHQLQIESRRDERSKSQQQHEVLIMQSIVSGMTNAWSRQAAEQGSLEQERYRRILQDQIQQATIQNQQTQLLLQSQQRLEDRGHVTNHYHYNQQNTQLNSNNNNNFAVNNSMHNDNRQLISDNRQLHAQNVALIGQLSGDEAGQSNILRLETNNSVTPRQLAPSKIHLLTENARKTRRKEPRDGTQE